MRSIIRVAERVVSREKVPSGAILATSGFVAAPMRETMPNAISGCACRSCCYRAGATDAHSEVPMSRFLLLTFLAVFACAAIADDDATKIATEALHKIAPNAKVQSVAPAPLAGFYAVVADGHPIYVSTDGKYLVEGHVVDIAARRDVMEDSLSGVRKAALQAIPAEKKLTFAPAHPKYRVTVFTDVDCPYCRQFHKQIADYNKLGIAVDYLLFPLPIHKGADVKAQTVWCSKDRNATFTDAMNGQALPPKTCANPISEVTSLAEAAGVTGTPAVFAADGTMLGGYIAPDQLAKRLDEIANPKAMATN
jgi:thiol:disulfide interchange protein DsbC